VLLLVVEVALAPGLGKHRDEDEAGHAGAGGGFERRDDALAVDGIRDGPAPPVGPRGVHQRVTSAEQQRQRLDVQFGDVADVSLDPAASQVGTLVLPAHQTRDAVASALQVLQEEGTDGAADADDEDLHRRSPRRAHDVHQPVAAASTRMEEEAPQDADAH
jgi:hypothetical protein